MAAVRGNALDQGDVLLGELDGPADGDSVFICTPAAASTVTFGKVTSVDQISADNIKECTFDDAKAWVLDNWDDAHNSENYVVLAYSDGTNICAVYIVSDMTKEQFDQITTSTYTTTIADLKTFFSSYSADIYLCGFEPAASTVSFGKVTSADDITAENISECTFADAKAWILDNWDDIKNDATYVDIAYSDGTDIYAVYIPPIMAKEQFTATSTGTTTIEKLKSFFNDNEDVYLCGFEGAATAYAGYVPAETDDANALAAKVVKFNGYDWYLIEDNSTAVDAGSVTLLAADHITTSCFYTNNSQSTDQSYNGSTVKAYLDGLTTGEGTFASVADAIVPTNLTTYAHQSTTEVYETTTGAKLYLLSVSEANNVPINARKTSDNKSWWLRSPGGSDYGANGNYYLASSVNGLSGEIDRIGVTQNYGVRPALTLDLSKVEFNSETKTFALPAAHEHDFSYSKKDAATITATCWADGCTLTDSKVTLTIVAPTLTVYGGTGSEAATLDGLDAFNEATELAISADSIKYYNATKEGTDYTKTGDALAAAPTNAGDYVAEILLPVSTAKIAGTPIRVGYTIAKADINPTVSLEGWTYGETAKTPVVTGNSGNGDVTYTYAKQGVKGGIPFSETVPTDAGNYVVKATIAATANYNGGEATAEFTIAKKAASVTAANKSKTYGAADPALTATVEGTVGTDIINYTLSRAEGNNVGEYTITVNLGDNPNYDVTTTNAKLTIGKKAATVTADNKSKTYGDADPTLTAVVEGIVGTDTINYTLSRAEGNNVGEYAITVTLGENPNYDVTVTNAKLTIGKKAATVTAANKSKTYGAADPALTAAVEGTVGTDTINYTLSRAEGNNVGEYAITVTLGENPNYEVAVTGAKLTIGKKAATVTANNKAKTYGEADPALTATVEGTVGTDIINYTLSRAKGNNVGEYAITVTLGENPNYEVTATNGSFTINKKTVTVKADNRSKTYGDADPALTYTASGLVGGDTLTGSLARAAGENAGTYAITQGTLAVGANYSLSFTGATLTIGTKNIKIVANDQKKDVETADPELTYTVEGLVAGDTLTGSLARAEGEAVGIYAITLGTLTAGNNYVVDYTGATLTICATHVETDVNIDENAPEMNVEGINEDVANAILTEEEKQAIDEGKEVKVYLEIIAVDEKTVPTGDKTEIEKEAETSGMKVGMYLDLSLLKQIGESEAIAVHDTDGNMIKVTITVPEELRSTNPIIKRTFYVVRVHNGETTVLGASTEDTVSFETDKFSTYSLMYKDVSFIWLWILIIAVVIIAACTVVFFVVKKKKKTTK